MGLEEGDPVLAVLDDRPVDLQAQLAAADRDDLGRLVGPGQERGHADLGDRRDRAEGGLNGQVEVVLQDLGQLAGHLEPQGIDPDVGDLALAELRLHLRLEDVSLPQQAGDRVLRLAELGDEVLGQFASRPRCTAARP